MGEGTSPRDGRGHQQDLVAKKIWGGKWSREKESPSLKLHFTHPESRDDSTYFIRVDLTIGQ